MSGNPRAVLSGGRSNSKGVLKAETKRFAEELHLGDRKE